MRRAVRAVVVVAAVIAGAVACSSTPTPTPAAAPTSTAATVPRATSSTAGVSPAAPTSAAPSGAPFAATGDFCADLKRLEAAPPASASTDPAAGFRALDDLKGEAPPDLRDVFDLLATAIAQLATTNATDQAAVQQAYAALSDPKFVAGFQRLADYAKSTCGVDLQA